jgi:hypothetical protein
MKRKYLVVVLALFLFFSEVQNASALMKRTFKSTAPASKTSGGSVGVTPRLADRQNLRIYFSNVKSAKTIDYELTYVANGLEQGVFGSVKGSAAGSSVTRTMYFGTCSHKVCTPHRNIKNMKLTVTINSTAGKTTVRRFKIKI